MVVLLRLSSVIDVGGHVITDNHLCVMENFMFIITEKSLKFSNKYNI